MAVISKTKLAALAAFFSVATAAPALSHPMSKRAFDCGASVQGLSQEDCQHLSDIGFAGQGANPNGNNGNIWVGDDGATTMTFTNNADGGVPVTLIVWDQPPGDFQSSFMNVRTPKISYSLNNGGDSVTISFADAVSGGFSAIYNRVTTLSQYGQVFNTWGEFTTGAYGTIDISREVNMGGNGFSAQVASGCLTDMNTCVFTCRNGANSCGEPNTYDLTNCDPNTNPHAAPGEFDGQPSGGCQGLEQGGHVDVSFFG